jgi:hypothetical protein
LPRLYDGHNRTFFLVSYEAGRIPGTREANANVPTAAMRAGDFRDVSWICQIGFVGFSPRAEDICQDALVRRSFEH